MPYVPPEMKERIKREVSIQRLAEARGIKLTRRGKSLMGLCPFHKDRNPSLSVDPVENVWNCLGACGEGGDVISWVMRAEGISFTHAVELLKRNYLPSPASAAEPPPKQSSVPGAQDNAGAGAPHIAHFAMCGFVRTGPSPGLE